MNKRVIVSALSVSLAGLTAIANFEGFSDTVYEPVPGDLPTVGFGHADSSMQIGDKITREQAEKFLRQDAGKAERAVRRCVHVPLYQHEFDAYTSFVFNVGEGNFCNSTLVRKLNAGDYDGACEELRRWVYAQGRVYRGLVMRREKEMLMCRGVK